MVFRRNIIVLVWVVLLLLGGITCGCLFYLSHEQDERDSYATCRAMCYIPQPTQAYIFLINDVSGVAWSDIPYLSDALLPTISMWQHRTADSDKPMHVAYYPSGDAAVWCAITSSDVERVMQYVTDSVCNGYRPVAEDVERGKMFHFATRDNRFLHLYVAPGIMGCSYRERLLLPDSEVTKMAVDVDSLQRLSNCGVLYYTDDFHYNDIFLDEGICEIRWIVDDSLNGLGEIVALDTALISHKASMVLQTNKSHHSALASTAVLAYVPSHADSMVWDCVVAVSVKQPDVLFAELLSVYTSYGYRADSVAVKQWIDPQLVTSKYCWMTVRDGILYASPSHGAMWSYVADLRRGDYKDDVYELLSASTIVAGDSIEWELLPTSIYEYVPSYVKDIPVRSLQITPCSRGCRYSVRLGDYKK